MSLKLILAVSCMNVVGQTYVGQDKISLLISKCSMIWSLMMDSNNLQTIEVELMGL